MSDHVIIALTTCPNDAAAATIAEALVTERLAACVNQLPGVTSTYWWQGEVQRDSEVLLIIKTLDSRWPALRARIQTLHPYELPEVIALPVCAGSEPYLDWIRQSIRPVM